MKSTHITLFLLFGAALLTSGVASAGDARQSAELTIKGTCNFHGTVSTWSGKLTPTGTPGVYDAKYTAAWGSKKEMTYSGQLKTDLKTEVSGQGEATGGGGNGTFKFAGKFGKNGVATCPYSEVGGTRKRSGTLTVDSIK